MLASFFRRFWVDSLLASVLVSVTLDSLRGKSDTLEFDDPYEGFATFCLRRKMKERSKLVGKPKNLDVERGLPGDGNLTTILYPF